MAHTYPRGAFLAAASCAAIGITTYVTDDRQPLRRPGKATRKDGCFLDDDEAREYMRREIWRLKQASVVKSIIYDVDGIGFVATVSGASGADYTQHWHNSAFDWHWQRRKSRVADFDACVRRYRRDDVIRSFARFPYRRVRCFAEAMGRMGRLDHEHQAALGGLRAARYLGMSARIFIPIAYGYPGGDMRRHADLQRDLDRT